jgi:hypothetical protein
MVVLALVVLVVLVALVVLVVLVVLLVVVVSRHICYEHPLLPHFVLLRLQL